MVSPPHVPHPVQPTPPHLTSKATANMLVSSFQYLWRLGAPDHSPFTNIWLSFSAAENIHVSTAHKVKEMKARSSVMFGEGYSHGLFRIVIKTDWNIFDFQSFSSLRSAASNIMSFYFQFSKKSSNLMPISVIRGGGSHCLQRQREWTPYSLTPDP